MTVLVGYSFDTVEGGQQMLCLIKSLIKKEIITVEDAALVNWPENRTKPMARHLGRMTETGGLGTAFWGMLFGLIFFIPFFGMAFGAAMGALTGHYSAYGIDKTFIAQARNKVTVGTSALFLLTSETMQKEVADVVKKRGLKVETICTDISNEQEKQLQEDFGA